MSEAEEIWPEEGELLVCTVKGVKENGAYLNLDGYGDKEGFVFIGEVASGWVKNIRAHLREGKRVVAKVVTIKKDRERVDLSIKAVSAERRKDTLQTWKNQQRATQIMRVAAQRVNWDEEKTEAVSEEMIEILKVMEIDLNLDQIIQTTIILKEKFQEETITMLRS